MRSLRGLVLPILRACAAFAILSQALGPAALSVAGSGHCGSQRHAGRATTVAHGAAVQDGRSMPAGCTHCPGFECAILVQCAGAGTAAASPGMPIVAAVAGARGTALDTATAIRSLALTPPTPPPLLAS